MTPESILERINQKPFRPIALETVGGTWIEIDRAEDIFIVYVRRTHLVERARFDALLGYYFCPRIITYQETANLSILIFPFSEVIQDGFHAVF